MNISKYLLKYVFAAMVVLAAIDSPAAADDKAKALVARAGSILKEYSDYKVLFTVVSDDIDDIKGEYTVSRDRYDMRIDDQRQFSDGKLKYDVYYTDREVQIDKLDLSSSNILMNPTRAFDFAPSEFNASYQGEVNRNGRKMHSILLTPIKTMRGISNITLYVNIESGLPAAISYSYEGEMITINIDSVEKLKTVDETLFRYSPSDFRGYDIIDFR